jgi:multiple sugar transport system substrate-binding protein
MRRRIRVAQAVALAAALAIGVTGCAISSNSGTSASGSDSNKKVTLTFWEYYTGTSATWIKSQVKKFEKANPNVTIDVVETVGAQQDQKLLGSVATKTTPDLFLNNIVVDYPSLVAAGVAKNLTPYWNSYADKDKFPSSAVFKTDGKVYNLMTYTNLVGLFYNKDILDAVGIKTPPTTLDQLQTDLAKVKADGRYQGIALSGAPTVEGAWLFAPQLLGQGINYCNFSGSKVTAAFDRVADWSKQGYTPLATATWDQNAAWQQFFTGKYAFGINGNWQLGGVKSASFKYGTGEFPTPPGGKSVVYPGGEGFGIGADSKHPAIAWKFLQQMILSKQGEESAYAAAGNIPVRSDVADISALKTNKFVQPFVKAAATSGTWPNNTNTANMQVALGKAVSGVISGQSTAAQGAQQAISGIKAAEKAGGGTCK